MYIKIALFKRLITLSIRLRNNNDGSRFQNFEYQSVSVKYKISKISEFYVVCAVVSGGMT